MNNFKIGDVCRLNLPKDDPWQYIRIEVTEILNNQVIKFKYIANAEFRPSIEDFINFTSLIKCVEKPEYLKNYEKI